MGTLGSQDSSVADRLVYLTGIPKDATEQEVTDLVGSLGKINNVILMPCSEEESEKGEGQKVLLKCNIMVINAFCNNTLFRLGVFFVLFCFYRFYVYWRIVD